MNSSASFGRLGGWRHRRSPATLLLVVAFRLLALLLSSEVSGTVHTALDLTIADHVEDDCAEWGGCECPPGCPNCHRSHSATAWTVPSIELRLEGVPLAPRTPGTVPDGQLAPPRVDLSRLDRPPRAVA